VPQENGNRIDVRWAELGGLRVDGDPHFDLATGSCGPGTLPQHTLRPEAATFAVVLSCR
jgi:beta-galactosidase